MNTPSRSLSFSGLRAVHNSRTRIFAAGRDPLFGATARSALHAARASDSLHRSPALPPSPRLWRSNLLDRLESPLTRYRE
jgi:hypothetical protein